MPINLMCDYLLRGECDEAIEIEWGAMALEVQKDPYGMGQDFADQAMLKMPQIMHAQASNGDAPQGSGLGLAIVKSVAERHGARVLLEDASLGGLRVAVRFPASEPTQR